MHDLPEIVNRGLASGADCPCAMDKRQRLISDIPTDAIPINSALLRSFRRISSCFRFCSRTRSRPSSTVLRQLIHDLEMTSSNSSPTASVCAQQYRATMQTEGLLKQSQQLAGELQTQQKNCNRPTNSSSKRRNSWRA